MWVGPNGPYYPGEDDSFNYMHDDVIVVIYLNGEVAYGTVPTTLSDTSVDALYQVLTITGVDESEWYIYDLPINNGYVLRLFYSLSEPTKHFNN